MDNPLHVCKSIYSHPSDSMKQTEAHSEYIFLKMSRLEMISLICFDIVSQKFYLPSLFNIFR